VADFHRCTEKGEEPEVVVTVAGHITRNSIPELEKPESMPEKSEPEKPDHYFG